MLDSTQRATAAELLWAAERDLAPVDPLTETFPGIDVTDAYEIQLINIRRKIAAVLGCGATRLACPPRSCSR